MFLGGIFKNLKEFVSDHREWHAVVNGLADGFCPWRPRHEPDKERLSQITSEYHYYNGARGLGFGCLLVLSTILIICVAVVIGAVT